MPGKQSERLFENCDEVAEEHTSPYKLINQPESSANTFEKAKTYHRSVVSSESASRSPNLIINSNSNLAANFKVDLSNKLEINTKEIVDRFNSNNGIKGKNYTTYLPLKTYVLNKSRKLIDNLNRSEKD